MGGGNRNKSKKSKKPKIRKIDPKQFDNRRETTTTTNTNTNNKKLTTKQQLQNKVQQRFKDREAKGLDGLTGMRKISDAERKQGKTQLTQYRAAQRDQVQNAAYGRQATFKTGIPSGDNLKAGSFGISEAGKAQAEANKQEKAAADMAARSQNMFSASNTFNTNFDLGAAKGFNTISVANMLAPKGGLSSYYMSGNRPNLNFNQAMKLENSMHQQTGKFNPNSKFNLSMYARGESNPFRGMPGYGTAKSLINPRIRDINMQRMFAGKPPLSMDKINPGGFQTAPTEGFRRLAPALGAFVPGLSIGNRLFNEGKADSATTQAINSIGDVNLGGLTITSRSPESTDIGARAGRFISSIPGRVVDAFTGGDETKIASAGGLNIGDSSAETSEGSATGRTLGNRLLGGIDAIMRDTTDFDKRGVGNPAAFGLENTVAGSVLNAAAQETGTINQFRKDTDNFSNLTNFNKLSNDEKVKTAQNVLKFTNDSQAAQALGEGLGLGKDFKTKINDAVDNVQGRLEGVTADRDSLYGVTSDFARDIGTDPDLNPINKFLTATATDNLGEAGKEKNILGMTNEMARDIKAAFQDDSPTTKGLSAEQRGIVGQFGNRILSGKATDGLREATYGYGGREGAVNAGLTEGQPLNFSDIQNTALAMKDNLGTDTTLASKRFDEAKRLVTPDGVTAGSLIRGSLPRFGNRTGSSGSTSTMRGTGTTAPAATPMEELLIPQTPTYTAPTQTGTDTSNLQQIQQQSYMQNLAQLGITNLMQLPQFRTQQQRAPRRFRSFRRDYF